MANPKTGAELPSEEGSRSSITQLERTARAALRRARRAQEYRERIFHAAIALFAERGLHQVTVEQITERAEVGKGTFFNYFENKEAVIAEFLAEEVARLSSAIAAGEVQGPPPERILQSLLLLAGHPLFTKEFVRGLFITALSTAHFSEAEGRGIWELRGIIAGIVEEGQESGHFRKDVPAPEAGLFVFGQYLVALLLWSSSFAGESLQEIVTRYVRLGLRALGS